MVSGAAAKQLLQVSFDAVLLQSRVDSHLDLGVREHFVDRDAQRLALGAGDGPTFVVEGQAIRGVHPVQWFVGTTVGVDRNTAVGFDHDESNGFGQMSGEATVVVDSAAGDDKTH